MADHLDTLYKVLTREQTTGYSGSSVLGDFEKFTSEWCDKVLLENKNEQVRRILNDMRSTSKGYQSAPQEVCERKIAEMGRMLLSLRDALQQAPDPYEEESVVPHKNNERSEPDTHKDRGMAYKQEGRLSEAIAEFESALESESDDHFALSHLSHIYLLQDKLEESSRIIDRALKANPGNPFAHSVRGEILFKEGNMEEAAAVFEEVLNLNPGDRYAHSKLGVIYRMLGKTEQAVSVLERGLELNPEDSSLHHALGDVYVRQGKDEEAIAQYQKAIDLDPEDDYAFRGLLSSKSRGRDNKAIISQLQKVLKIPSRRQNAHLHALLGRYLRQEKQYEEAADEFREAVKLQPRSLYFQTQLAFCYSKLEQYSRVIEILEPIQKVKSRDPIVARALAKAYSGVERIEDARKILIDILYLYPNDRSLRQALVKLGKSKPPLVTVKQNEE